MLSFSTRNSYIGCYLFTRMNTGSAYLDQFYTYKGLTIVYGEPATGKTTLALLTALFHAQKGKVIFIDTEAGFSIERIKQLNANAESLLQNVLYKHAKNFFKQGEAIKNMLELDGVDIVIIDTIGSHFRSEVKKDPEKMQQLLGWQIETLRKISKHIPVIITNQVYQDPKTGKVRMTAERILKPWADMIIHLEKEPRRVTFERPEKETIPFTITEKGITY